MEDYGKLPWEMYREVHQVVEKSKSRSGWPVRKTLKCLGLSATSYYRWLRQRGFGEPEATRLAQPFEALAEERNAVRCYALKHPGMRHREMAWKMVDEGVVCLSPSTVYRILREEKLVCPWKRRKKRSREESEKAIRPNEKWGTDLMYLSIGSRNYYLVTFLDEYSRYLVHHELLTSMDGNSISLAAQTAIDKLPRGGDGLPLERPQIRSDNGSGYISKEFREVLANNKMAHVRIRPHCPEENGLVERCNRTIREALEDAPMEDRLVAEKTIQRVIRWYNEERYHQALGYLRPLDYHLGDPKKLQEERRFKLIAARHRRKEINLGIRQQTLALVPQA